MAVMTFNELLADLGQHLGMQGLRLDDAACCQLVFDQRWMVTLMYQGALDRIALHCPIGSAQQAQTMDAAALHGMLQANFLGRGTGRCQLSICPEGRVCMVLELALVETDTSVLAHGLEQLLNQAEIWSQWLESGSNAAVTPAQLLQTRLNPQQPLYPGLQSPLAAANGRAADTQPCPAQVDGPHKTQRLRDWTNQRV